VVLSLKHGDGWDYITFNLAALFAALFFYEKKIHAKISERFSTFSVFVIASALSSFFYFYVDDAAKILQREKEIMPDKMTDMVNYYSKQFAPNKEDGLMMMAVWNYFIFPRLNYLDKDNHQKFYTASILADYGEAKSLLMFPIHNKDSIFTVTYLFDDIKKSLRDPRTKVVFVNNSTKDLIKKNRCLVSSLEYYLFDYEFRKNFFKNFRFENRVIIDQEVKVLKNVPLLTGVAPSVFDQVKKSNRQVWYDFEVYVRK